MYISEIGVLVTVMSVCVYVCTCILCVCVHVPVGLTRGYDKGVERLLSLGDGLATIRLCLAAENQKMVVKTLFLLMSYFSTTQGEAKGKIISNLMFW